jgi:uncharacterized protein YhfF
MGDSPQLANELADLIKDQNGLLRIFLPLPAGRIGPEVGSYKYFDGKNVPVCVIRLISMQLVRFCDVTEAFARKEGEGDLSLEYWKKVHQRFSAQGHFSEDMELIAEEFEVVEVLCGQFQWADDLSLATHNTCSLGVERTSCRAKNRIGKVLSSYNW